VRLVFILVISLLFFILLPYVMVLAAGVGYLAIRDITGTVWTMGDIEELYSTTTYYQRQDGEVLEVSYGDLFILKIDNKTYTLRNFTERNGIAVLPLSPGYYSVEVWFGYYHEKRSIKIEEGVITYLDLGTAPATPIETLSSGFTGYTWYAYSTGSETRIVRSDNRVVIRIPVDNNVIYVDIVTSTTTVTRIIKIDYIGYPEHGFDEEQFKFDTNSVNQTVVRDITSGFSFLGIINADTGTIVKRVANASFYHPFGVKQIGLYTYTLLITADVNKLDLLEHVSEVGFYGVLGELLFMPRGLGIGLSAPEAIVAGYRAFTWWRAGLTAGTVARGVLAGAGGLAISTYMLGNALQGAYEYLSTMLGESVTQTVCFHVAIITTNTRTIIIAFGWFIDPYGRVYPIQVYGYGLVPVPYMVRAGDPDNPVDVLTVAGVRDIEYSSEATGYATSYYSRIEGDIYSSSGYAYVDVNGSERFNYKLVDGDHMYIGSDLNKLYYKVDDLRQYTLNIRYSVLGVVNGESSILEYEKYNFYVVVKIISPYANAIADYLASKGYNPTVSNNIVTVNLGFTEKKLDDKHILWYINKELDFNIGPLIEANITIGLRYGDDLNRLYVKLSSWGAGIYFTYTITKHIMLTPNLVIPVDIIEDGIYTVRKAFIVQINHIRIKYDDDYLLSIYLLRGIKPEKLVVFRDVIVVENISASDIDVVYVYTVMALDTLYKLADMMVVNGYSEDSKTYVNVSIRGDLEYFENATFMFLGRNAWSILYLPSEVVQLIWEPREPPGYSGGYGLDVLAPSGEIITIGSGELYVYNYGVWVRVDYELVNTSYVIREAESGGQVEVIENNSLSTYFYKYIENKTYTGWLWNDNLTLRLIVAAKAINTLPPNIFRELWEKSRPSPPQIYVSMFDDKLLDSLGAWWNQNWKWLLLGLGIFLFILLLLFATGRGRVVVVNR